MDLDRLMNKHLTRAFDPSKTIPEETLQKLLRFLRSTPTSTNVQPNHFYVIGTTEGKEKLVANLGERFQDNSPKILSASHTIILTTGRICPRATSRRCSTRRPPTAGSVIRRSARYGSR